MEPDAEFEYVADGRGKVTIPADKGSYVVRVGKFDLEMAIKRSANPRGDEPIVAPADREIDVLAPEGDLA